MNETGLIQQENIGLATPGGTAVNVWSDKTAFDQMTRVASMLSKSTIVPQSYQGKPEDCFIAVEMATRMNTSPLFIMQNLYVVKGKPSWAGQACMAMITACGKFKNVKHVYTGTRGTENRGCYVTAQRISDGEILQGTEVTVKMAKDEGWYGSNSKWRNMTEQMLGYRAASFFARMFCPEAMMGLHTAEEEFDANPDKPVNTPQNLANAILEEKAMAAAEVKTEPVTESVTTNAPAPTAEPEAPEAPTETVPEPAPATEPEVKRFFCQDCGNEIKKSGKFTPEALAKASTEKYGRPLCVKCGQKAKAQAEQEAYQKAMAEQDQDNSESLAAQLMADAEE